MGADQKQAAVTKKPSVSLASLNASHPLTKTAPSVKSVTGMPMSCSPEMALNGVEAGLGAWTTTMWWLIAADGPFPIGDAIYWGGVAWLAVTVELNQKDILSSDNVTFYKEHSKNKRKSNENKHQEGDARRMRDQGGEKKKQKSGWTPKNPKRGVNNYVRMPRKVLYRTRNRQLVL